jgi:c-di-GMP-binding flagellar brake protein YcgR
MEENLREAGSERRRFVRLNASCDVNYKVLKTRPIISDKSLTKNISAGGICFIANDKLNPESVLELNFDLLDKKSIIKAKGRVVWTKSFKIATEPERFDCGVEFIEINPSDRKRIDQYVFSYK